MKASFKEFIQKYGFEEVAAGLPRSPFYPVQYNREKEEDKRYLFYDTFGQEFLGLCIYKSSLSDEEIQEILTFIATNSIPLKSLVCSHTQLKTVELSGPSFTELGYLKLTNNAQLTQTTLKNLPKLEQVFIHDCTIQAKVQITGNCEKLNYINVSNCALQELELPENLPLLTDLQIKGNQLSDFGFLKFIKNNTVFNLERLMWEGNPFPETFVNTLQRNDIETLKGFFVEQLIDVYRKKLILLGNTQAGKTSLCDILKDENLADGNSTHGVNISRYVVNTNDDGKSVEGMVLLYDFGGQDFYHNAHMPFYAMNTNYLLVYGNNQNDEYGCIRAHKIERDDDIFPMTYWLNSVKANLQLNKTTTEQSLVEAYEQKGVKLAILENLTDNQQRRKLNELDLFNKFGVTDLWGYQLKVSKTEKLPDSEQETIKSCINSWLAKSLKKDTLPRKIKEWDDKLRNEQWDAVSPKSAFDGVSEEDFNLLHDSYAIFQCEKQEKEELPLLLQKNVIVDLGRFTKWVYAILNLRLQRQHQGVFDLEIAKKYLNEAQKDAKKAGDTFTFANAEKHLDFIIEFLKYYQMIFSIKESHKYLVPQYLPKPEEKDTTDVVLLQLFDSPFVEYIFEGFYHTQLLTAIIAKFFEQEKATEESTEVEIKVAKKKIKNEYQYLIWKNKVILYLNKDDKLNPKDFLLIEFTIDFEKQQPMLVLREMGQHSLKEVYRQVEEVIKFIESQLANIEYKKRIKTPNNTYISADLLQDNNHEMNGNKTDLIYDPEHKYFYRKGDFPLFFDPKQFTMKKIFISYSKSDEKYKNEFKKHFFPLKRQSLIDTFDDSDLGFGEWNSEILKKIEECDIFVCLVSIDFLNTDYIINTELLLDPAKIVINKRK
jgi:internalin A